MFGDSTDMAAMPYLVLSCGNRDDERDKGCDQPERERWCVVIPCFD